MNLAVSGLVDWGSTVGAGTGVLMAAVDAIVVGTFVRVWYESESHRRSWYDSGGCAELSDNDQGRNLSYLKVKRKQVELS